MKTKTLAKAIFICTALLSLSAAPSSALAKKPSGDCRLNGHQLYGKVKVVTSFPDLKVKIVDSFPDLKVQEVTLFPDTCGKWEFVDSFPDFTIQYVESFPDLKIEYVSSFPGVP